VLAQHFENLPDVLKNFHQYFLVLTQYFSLRVNSTEVYTIMLVAGLCVSAIGTVCVTVAVALGTDLLTCNALEIL
jgi:hypothetical protein